MSEILEPIKKELSERLSSPLISSFVISWALWNYKFLLIMVSSNSISITFSLVEKYCFNGTIDIVIKGLILPCVTTLAYIYLYPIPAEIIYKRTHQNNQRLKEIKNNIENETPLTLEESRKIRLQLFQANETHSKEMESKNAEIESLKEALKASRDPLNTFKLPPYTKYKALPQLQQEILEAIAKKTDGKLQRRLLLKELQGTPVEVEFALGELREDGLIHDVFNEDREVTGYQITHKGRGNLLNNLQAREGGQTIS